MQKDMYSMNGCNCLGSWKSHEYVGKIVSTLQNPDVWPGLNNSWRLKAAGNVYRVPANASKT